jgi:hypothetical protein
MRLYRSVRLTSIVFVRCKTHQMEAMALFWVHIRGAFVALHHIRLNIDLDVTLD